MKLFNPLLLITFFTLGITNINAQCGPLSVPDRPINTQDGIMFDIVALNPVTITQFEMQLSTQISFIEIYTKPGGYFASRNTPGDWTLVGSAVFSGVNFIRMLIPITLNETICPGDTTAFYVTADIGVKYSNGWNSGIVYATDANIQLLQGHGKNYPFGGNFPNRIPRVNVIYTCPALTGPPSDAGADQNICSDSTALAANIAANLTGVWSVVSGSGTISDVSDPNTTVTGLTAGLNQFRWATCDGVPDTVNITVHQAPTMTASADTTFCPGDIVPLSSFVSTPVGATYSWTNSNPTIGIGVSGNGNIPTFTATNPTTGPISGTLTVTPTLNGCTGLPTSYIITVNDSIVADSLPDVISCDNYILPPLTSGNNYFSAPGGIGPIAAGSNITTSQTIYIYAQTGTIPNCTDENSFQVTINNTPTVIILSADTITCGVTSITLDGSTSIIGANPIYLWTTVGGNIISATNTASVDVGAPGNYTLTITENGCSSQFTTTVYQGINSPTSIITQPILLTCNTTSLTLDGSGSFSQSGNNSYSWVATLGGNIISGTTADTINIDAPGNYTLTITDNSNGCMSSNTVIVLEDTISPSVMIVAPITLTCSTSSQILDGSGSISNSNNTAYIWTTTAGGNITSGTTSDTANINSPGDYTLTVTDTDNGCVNSITTTVTQNILAPTALIATPVAPSCTSTSQILDGSASTSFSGTMIYNWVSTLGGNITSGNTSSSVNINSSGDYTLTITDPVNGCSKDSTLTIVLTVAAPTAVILAPLNLTCVTLTQTLNGSGSTSNSGNIGYSWSTSNGNITSTTTAPTIDIDSIGDYTLVITDLTTGCTDTTMVTVVQDKVLPTVIISLSDTLDCITTAQILDGSGSITNSGTYNYSWSTTGGNFTSATGLPIVAIDTPGSYMLEVIDPINGCLATTSTTVYQNISQPIAIGQIPQPLCEDISGTPTTTVVNLSILDNTINGGNGYPIVWYTDISLTNAVVNPLSAITATQTYYAQVTDPNNGCTNIALVNYTVNALPAVVFSENTLGLCEESDLPFIFSTDTSGGGFSSVLWSFGDGNTKALDIVNHTYNSTGSYNVTLTLTSSIQTGECINATTKTVTVYEKPTANFHMNPNPATMFDPTINFIDKSFFNSPAFSWLWDFGGLGSLSSSDPTFTFLEDKRKHNVTLIVTDVNGCKDSITKTVIITGEHAVYIPNAFSPDGNGENDIFKPQGFGISNNDYSLRIYNRWGELMFETENFDNGWNGTYKAKDVPLGTYLWQLSYMDINEVVYQKTGKITVLR